MVIARSKVNRPLVVALIMIGLSAFGWATSRPNPLPNMPHHSGQGIYLRSPTPLNPIRQPLLP
jgi:hypothetical protein